MNDYIINLLGIRGPKSHAKIDILWILFMRHIYAISEMTFLKDVDELTVAMQIHYSNVPKLWGKGIPVLKTYFSTNMTSIATTFICAYCSRVSIYLIPWYPPSATVEHVSWEYLGGVALVEHFAFWHSIPIVISNLVLVYYTCTVGRNGNGNECSDR